MTSRNLSLFCCASTPERQMAFRGMSKWHRCVGYRKQNRNAQNYTQRHIISLKILRIQMPTKIHYFQLIEKNYNSTPKWQDV